MPVRGDAGEANDREQTIIELTRAAHQELLATAARPNGAIDTATLARAIQKRSGIRISQSSTKWLGPLLAKVARYNQAHGEPLLPAFVVRRDGTVGQGFDELMLQAGVVLDGDRESFAAQQRALAHQKWAGAAVPSAASTGPRTTTVAVPKTAKAAGVKKAAPAPKRPAKPEPLQGNICPRCFMQMSLTGVCDNCD